MLLELKMVVNIDGIGISLTHDSSRTLEFVNAQKSSKKAFISVCDGYISQEW